MIKGSKHSPKSLEKISKSGIGRIPWNKGKKGVMPTPWNKGIHKKTNTGKTHFKKGQTPWNKGKKWPLMSFYKTGKNNHNWKGGIKKQKGYFYILKPKHPFCHCTGYIKRARFVMEQKLGRYLTKTERVHHVNGNKLDDRPKNLRLFKNHSIHMKFHHKHP